MRLVNGQDSVPYCIVSITVHLESIKLDRHSPLGSSLMDYVPLEAIKLDRHSPLGSSLMDYVPLESIKLDHQEQLRDWVCVIFFVGALPVAISGCHRPQSAWHSLLSSALLLHPVLQGSQGGESSEHSIRNCDQTSVL